MPHTHAIPTRRFGRHEVQISAPVFGGHHLGDAADGGITFYDNYLDAWQIRGESIGPRSGRARIPADGRCGDAATARQGPLRRAGGPLRAVENTKRYSGDGRREQYHLSGAAGAVAAGGSI